MNESNEKIASSPAVPHALQAAMVEGPHPAPSIASDRIYQLAAVTAGLFLLATLL